jgi:hypothetical protein
METIPIGEGKELNSFPRQEVFGCVASSVERSPDRGSAASRPTHTSGETSPRGNGQDEFC